MKKYNSQSWYDLAKDLYELILADINDTPVEYFPEAYPNFVVMYEFFRLVRGHAFNSSRPGGLGELQKEVYRMENHLIERLKPIEKYLLDIKNDRISTSLDIMKKSFSLKYFNHD